MVDIEYMRMKSLALAVIETAREDALRKTKDGKEDITAREAKIFLLGDTPLWKKSRNFWCALADLEPQYLERRVKKEPWYNRYIEQKETKSLEDFDIGKRKLLYDNKLVAKQNSEILLRNYMNEDKPEELLTKSQKEEILKKLDQAAANVVDLSSKSFQYSFNEFRNSQKDKDSISIGIVYSRYIEGIRLRKMEKARLTRKNKIKEKEDKKCRERKLVKKKN